MTTGPTAYAGLAAEYDELLGALAEDTWTQGVLADLVGVGVPRGATVLDLAAGTGIGGRLLHEVVPTAFALGLDNSRAMLRQTGNWYQRTVEADLCQIPLPDQSIDLAVSGFDSLNYLDGVQLGQCLAEAARVLRPAARLIFDYSSPFLLVEQWRHHDHAERLPDGSLHWRHHYDSSAGRCVTTLTRFHAGEVRWSETHVQYALDAFQLHQLAATAGLHVERVRDLHRTEFSPACRTHVWNLRRVV
jgi:ubiquinone/menaquinone biosynthesis C-methylase UbiE